MNEYMNVIVDGQKEEREVSHIEVKDEYGRVAIAKEIPVLHSHERVFFTIDGLAHIFKDYPHA